MTAITLPQAELQKRGYATRPLPVTAAASVASDVAKTRDQQCTDVRGSCPVADGSTMPHTSWQQQQQQKENQKHRKNVVELHYDAVIAGSGAGGGVTAAVLAAAGLRVLVLEQSSWVKRDGVCVCVVYGGCMGCLGGIKRPHSSSIKEPHHTGGRGGHAHTGDVQQWLVWPCWAQARHSTCLSSLPPEAATCPHSLFAPCLPCLPL